MTSTKASDSWYWIITSLHKYFTGPFLWESKVLYTKVHSQTKVEDSEMFLLTET